MTLVGVATALSLAAPASADPVTNNNFLSALTDAGIGYGDPTNTEQLGQSICPMLVEPGKNMASIYSTVSNNGINPAMASFFTGIAISMYCPQMMSSIGNGTFLNSLSGLQGIPGLSGIPGI
ncbi:hypothetical protein GGC64_003245 [Mycobacterium sp. OAS707]|uniref:DUF732 domain-containing protein n=1 Tax=unclassified Mycobacterium TaxID=2642494 RepID=UPI00178BC711|nr:hypothetical protein [Mycobacterium sp. OAS707]